MLEERCIGPAATPNGRSDLALPPPHRRSRNAHSTLRASPNLAPLPPSPHHSTSKFGLSTSDGP